MQAWEERYYDRLEAKEEGRTQGMEEGMDILLLKQIRKKLAKGLTATEIADMLEESEDKIRHMAETIEAHRRWMKKSFWKYCKAVHPQNKRPGSAGFKPVLPAALQSVSLSVRFLQLSQHFSLPAPSARHTGIHCTAWGSPVLCHTDNRAGKHIFFRFSPC